MRDARSGRRARDRGLPLHTVRAAGASEGESAVGVRTTIVATNAAHIVALLAAVVAAADGPTSAGGGTAMTVTATQPAIAAAVRAVQTAGRQIRTVTETGGGGDATERATDIVTDEMTAGTVNEHMCQMLHQPHGLQSQSTATMQLLHQSALHHPPSHPAAPPSHPPLATPHQPPSHLPLPNHSTLQPTTTTMPSSVPNFPPPPPPPPPPRTAPPSSLAKVPPSHNSFSPANAYHAVARSA